MKAKGIVLKKLKIFKNQEAKPLIFCHNLNWSLHSCSIGMAEHPKTRKKEE
jgi:hypothetical protein